MYVTSTGNHKIVRFSLAGGSAEDLGNPGGLLAGESFGLALDLAPDLRTTLTNTIGGGLPNGGDFNWTLRVFNEGTAPASFFNGQVLVRDNLPPGPTYGAPAVTYSSNVTYSDNIHCRVTDNVLTCTANFLPVTLNPASRFDVLFNVRPKAPGKLINPTGGVCRADPDNRIPESHEDNKDCADAVSVNVPVLGRQMYVTNMILPYDHLSRGNLDGTYGAILGNLDGFLSEPAGVALDLVRGKLYVASSRNNKIIRANLDGSSPEDLGNLGGLIYTPQGIALDLAPGKMYVTSYRNNKVVRANLDGSGPEDLGNLGNLLNQPYGIALDLAGGKMYVLSCVNSKIVRADLDGGNPEDLGNLNGSLTFPWGIALDLRGGKMYVTSGGNNNIVRANLDGSSPEDLGNPGGLLSGAVGIALDLAQGRMYVTSFGHRKVVQANLEGTDAVDLGNLNGSLTFPWGIALDTGYLVFLPLLLR
jgi:DNA-binding beta-propeller fold protein YncE